MTDNGVQNESKNGLQMSLLLKHNQECLEEATLTSNTLSKLNITIETLPRRCQKLIKDLAITQIELSIGELDLPTIIYQQTIENTEKFDQEYELLKLRQKNKELQVEIDRNNAFLQELKKDLLDSKKSIKKHTMDNEKELKMKVLMYEKAYEKTKARYVKFPVSNKIMPANLVALSSKLALLRVKEKELCKQAGEIQQGPSKVDISTL